MSDLELTGEGTPLSARRPVVLRSLKGRSRAYALRGGARALAVALNDRCDIVSATVLLPTPLETAVEGDPVPLLEAAHVSDWAAVA